MPKNLTKFKTAWLSKKDKTGVIVNSWCVPDSSSPHQVYCNLCKTTIKCGNSGLRQLLHHAEGSKHSKAYKDRYDASQRHFECRPQCLSASMKSSNDNHGDSDKMVQIVQTASQNEKIATAEILWAMKVAHCNYSYSSCEKLPLLFKRMFSCDISEQFTLSKTKVSYLISDGLGPYFRKELCESIRETGACYTLMFDETGNSQNRKQCDLLVRYWSEETGQIAVRFLKALMFGHAKADQVSEAIIATLTEEGLEIPLKQLISLGSDGPNVNKSIWNKINEYKKEVCLKGLTPFIPCNLHIVHNAFREGLKEFGEDAEQLILDLFYYFKASPCRKEDFFKTQFELGFDEQSFIKHVQCRWLTLIPAVKRVLDQMEVIEEYFFKEIPQAARKNKTMTRLEYNERYRRICQKLKDPNVKVQLYFLSSIEELFQPFLTLFQREEPLIHIVYDQLSQFVRTIMLRFLKVETVGSSSGAQLLKVDLNDNENQLPNDKIVVGEKTRKVALNKMRPETWIGPIEKIRKFYQVVTKYLTKHLPLKQKLLQDFGMLHPLMQKSESGVDAIMRAATQMPFMEDSDIDSIADEWKIYQSQEIPETWYLESGTEVYKRIDTFWGTVLRQKDSLGLPKYRILSKFVKGVLCLAHGNADVERSLSQNKLTVTNERVQLSDTSINGLRLVKDAVNVIGEGNVHLMPITPGLIRSRKFAYRAYSARIASEQEVLAKKKLEEERKSREIEERRRTREELDNKKKTLDGLEQDAVAEQLEAQEALCASESLFSEAERRLEKGIKSKDFSEVTVVHGLMEVAKQKMATARETLKRKHDEIQVIRNKKQKVFNKYLNA